MRGDEGGGEVSPRAHFAAGIRELPLGIAIITVFPHSHSTMYFLKCVWENLWDEIFSVKVQIFGTDANS